MGSVIDKVEPMISLPSVWHVHFLPGILLGFPMIGNGEIRIYPDDGCMCLNKDSDTPDELAAYKKALAEYNRLKGNT